MSLSPDLARADDPALQAPQYVRNIARYVPGKPIDELAREFGLAERDIVKLASNENPRGPSPAVRAAITPLTRIVFVANPNNPTGTWVTPDALEAFIASVPADVLVVLDEAYNEYLDPEQHAPSAAWTAKYANLVVSRTFSKAYGLAALRIGYGIMKASVADVLNRVRQPFNVNALAQAAALAALADTAYVEESRVLNRVGMRLLEEGVHALGLSFIPSHGNFLLIRVGDADRAYQRLLKQGVIVRPVANYGLPEFLRVTIGLPEENRRFLDALATVLAG